jgi:iron complex outermembrane receptor protein
LTKTVQIDVDDLAVLHGLKRIIKYALTICVNVKARGGNIMAIRTLLLGSTCVFILSGAAVAQTAPQVPASTPQAFFLDEVVVTAQKRTENLQDVPLTLSVFGAKQIEDARIVQVQDVANRTPGLAFDNFPSSQPRPVLRGIGSSDRGAAGDPSVSVFVDEVYYGRPSAVAVDAFDVDRIEVLKGPQGTLLGKNVVGGAVSVFNKRPGLEAFDAGAALTVGDYKRLEAAGFLNAPIVGDKAAVRISLSSRNHDGYTKNAFAGGAAEDQATNSGRLQLLLQPTQTFTALLAVDGTRDRGNGDARHTYELDPRSPASALWRINRERDQYYAENNGRNDRDTWGVRANLTWDLPVAAVTYIGSYRDLVYHYAEDFDGGNPALYALNFRGAQDEKSHFSSQELRLSALPSSKLRWVVGGYFYDGDIDRVDTLWGDIKSRPTPPATYAVRDRFIQGATVKSYALFGDATWPLTDQINVFGGLRYSKDDKDYTLNNLDSTALLRASAKYAIAASQSWDKVTWRIGGDYSPTDNVMVYGVVSTGFKSGGFQDTPSTATSAATPFNPETATLYELGAKTTLFDRRLTWNTSIYQTDYQDLQVRSTRGFDTITNNAGKARIRGLETSLDARLTERMRLSSTYAFTDGKFLSLFDRGADRSGNRMTRSPRHKLTLSPSYTLPLSSGARLEGAVDATFESKVYDDIDNNQIITRKPRTLVDAHLGYDSPDGHWNLSVWGKNLTDDIYKTHQVIFQGVNLAIYAPPRTVGATLRWKY